MKGAYAAKAWYTRRLGRLVDFAVRHRLSPDLFTAIGVAFGVLGGLAVWYGLTLLALLGAAGRLAGANLDGAVARARGVSRPFGFVLNEWGDRLGDLALGLGLLAACYATSDATAVALAWAALLAATLPTFVSLSGTGAGVPRINGGPFGKTERCIAYVLAALAVQLGHPGALPVVAGVIVVGSVLTALARTLTIRHALAGGPS